MSSLVDVFTKQHKIDDVLTMMGKVNDMVWEKGKKKGCKQCPAPISTLTKKVYFWTIAKSKLWINLKKVVFPKIINQIKRASCGQRQVTIFSLE